MNGFFRVFILLKDWALKILVTGAAGFIGMHCSERLLGRGDEVIGVDNLNDYYDVSLKEARLAVCDPTAVLHSSGSIDSWDDMSTLFV